jgi:hypothetical protein
VSTSSRRWERALLEIPVTLLVELKARLSKYSCLSVDLSQGGLRVRTHIMLEPKQTLKVVPYVLSDGSVYVVRSRVVWVGDAGSRLEGQSGLEFLEHSRRRFLL